MAQRLELLQGTLDMLVLKACASGPLHGHAIARRLRELSDEALTVEEGSLYPALHRLERKGELTAQWGKSENNRRARFYSLSRRGRARLRGEIDAWQRLCTAVGLVLAEPEGA